MNPVAMKENQKEKSFAIKKQAEKVTKSTYRLYLDIAQVAAIIQLLEQIGARGISDRPVNKLIEHLLISVIQSKQEAGVIDRFNYAQAAEYLESVRVNDPTIFDTSDLQLGEEDDVTDNVLAAINKKTLDVVQQEIKRLEDERELDLFDVEPLEEKE